MKTVQVIKQYKDMQLDRNVSLGEVFEVDDERAELLTGMELVEIIDEQAIEVLDLTQPLKTEKGVQALI